VYGRRHGAGALRGLPNADAKQYFRF